MSAIKQIDSGNVYHYTSEVGIQGILKNRSLHLRNIRHMNDKNEMKFFKDYLESYKTRKGISVKHIKYVLNEVERIKGYYEVFVFSSSSNKDSKPLWERYVKPKYNGYNIGFDIEKLKKIFNENEIIENNGNLKMFYLDGEILYSESKKRDIIDQNIASLIYHHTTNQEDANYNLDLSRTFLYFYLIFFKDELDWSKENEYRFAFFVEKNLSKQITKTIKRDNKIIYYISIDLKDENIEHPFEEIMIGAKNDFENDKNTLMKLFDSKHYYKELKNNISNSKILITSSGM